MPAPSARARLVQASPIRKLKPLADAARAGGKRIYHLNIGQPDIATPSAYYDGVKAAAQGVLAYSPSQGIDATLEAFARYYLDFGVPLSSDELIITTGGSEALVFALLATTDPGDDVLVPEPFYANYVSFAQMAGVRLVPIPTTAEAGFRPPAREVLDGCVTPRSKAILFCNPGNPTGVVYTRAELDTLAAVARAHDLFLIGDEVYREFAYDGIVPTSVLQLADVDDRAIIVDSISKRFSACGARIGVFATRNRELRDQVLKLAQARLAPPSLEQLGVVHMLGSPEYPVFIRDMIAEFTRRRDVVHAELSAVPGVVVPKPEGAFYVIAKLPVDDGERFVRWLLGDFAIDGETVMLAPAAEFYATPGAGRQEVRIAYVLETAALRQAMHILRHALETYPGRI
jgi:aspartate aminotransferase